MNRLNRVFRNNLAKIVAVNGMVLVGILALTELLISLLWHNPYRDEPLDREARLHAQRVDIRVSAEGFYPLNTDIRFRTASDRSVSSGRDDVAATQIALGGSTTEASLVPEGMRWPDLLAAATKNYGVSGNFLVDSYYNLVYLHEHLDPPPQRALIMHGVNDLDFFISRGAESFSIENWRHPLEHPLVTFDNTNRELIGSIRVSDSATMSLVSYLRNNVGARVIVEAYLAQIAAYEQFPDLPPQRFAELRQSFVEEFLPQRFAVLKAIHDKANQLGIEIALLSQAHAYRENYTPPVQDLRVTPIWQNAKLTLMQTAELIDLLNRQTLTFAETHNIEAIDLAACIARLDIGPLLFDSVHYTLDGSAAVAECVNEDLDWN